MVGHRAAYRLSLDRVRDNADIARAEGRCCTRWWMPATAGPPASASSFG
ncbi:hypothetical protein ACFQU2_23405 [Siccirubricoccus deserti]